jgi:hypothetical protein
MSHRQNLRIYISLAAAFVVLVVLQYFGHRYFQGNILVYAVDDMAPIPVIVLVVVFLFGIFSEHREQSKRKQQLMFLKSCMFRLEMRDLYIADFLALQAPPLTFAQIKTATLDELKQMRRQADSVEYRSPEAMEAVITEYAKAQDVWRGFLNLAMENGFEEIFQDMLGIVHFISDVKTFKEIEPGKLFIHEAAKDEAAMRRVTKILGDGVRKYLDYAIELKEKQPELFAQVVGDYELLARGRD